MPETVSQREVSTATGIGLKAIRSVAALGVRQILVQGLNALTGVVLARLLTPADFGLFGIITFVLTFLVAFGDVGLGASLIREADEPSEEDYQAVFTAQQLLVATVVAAAWYVSPRVAAAYHLPAHQVILLRLVALSLLFTSFRVVPSVRLERHLEFQKLAAVEVAQAVVFSGVTISTALAGLGPISFAWGLFSRSVAGAAIINGVSPWRIRCRWDTARIRRHLAFGLPYQGVAFTSLLKDSITPIFVGLVLGTSEVGYINWAGMVAAYPAMALMVLQRVYLPAFARMQSDTARLGAFVENVILATNAVVAPLAVITLVLIHPLTVTVFGAKWLVGLPLFQILWLTNLFVPSSTPVLGLLNALGRSRTTFGFATYWMLGTWVVGIPLILVAGRIGYGIATLFVTLSAPVLFRVAQRQVRFRVFRVVLPVWLVAAAAGAVIFALQAIWPVRSLAHLATYALAGLALAGVGMAKLYAPELSALWACFRATSKSRLVENAPYAV